MKITPWLVLTLTLSTSVIAQDAANTPAAPAPTKTSEPLAKVTVEKIAAMTPIFDGKSLNGWIQSPINYNLASGEIRCGLGFFERTIG